MYEEAMINFLNVCKVLELISTCSEVSKSIDSEP